MFVLVQIPCGVGGGWACVRLLCFIPKYLHTFLFFSAMMLSQCCRLSFWRCLFVLRVNFVHVSVGDTGGVVARVSCLGLSGCEGLLVPNLSFVVVLGSRF